MSSQPASFTSAKIDQLLVRRYIFAGLCASLDSIGLARFAFTPLVPELIQAHWFSASSVAYLAAANLAGYVCGALIGRPLATRFANEHILRLMMVLISAAFFACATPQSFSWYFAWRFVSGIAGGVVMVLVAATILPHVPAARKGAAGGAIFLGLGLGIAGSGTIIPLLLELGLAQTWIGLGIISVILTAASWFAWPSSYLHPRVDSRDAPTSHAMHFGRDIKLLYLQYALMAAAAVPPMVFLVDFVARGLGEGTYLGAVFWAIYGLGAIAGPPLYGYLADRLGAKPTVRIVSLVAAVGLAAFYVTDNLIVLGSITLVVGTFAPGIVPLFLARVHEVVTHNSTRQNVAWTRASIISAAALAVAAYAFSALFNATGGSHRLLFLTAAAMLIVSMLAGVATSGNSRAASKRA
ncbi:YbfB/YjiJ family MFS transporter [Rhizobium sp. P32RR-XVIII]|uniref:YbfB/YjiJ family MFS transporter n=1 Tax=Rhizobium sp. P32RR-XVIII TaxID=2726738 RepID=UPI00145706AC|nr:YbfB/YjiJ family MFS transporter [Rhizobium sp. P32RR-XVIII]NLS05232.1 YbfB/YjiJ family MFS transporter [Rhizobium sp. P32RR-XVIII]